MQLTGREIIGIYLQLKKHEAELDSTLESVAERIEALLFDNLSIEQFEELESLYRSNVDVPLQME